MPVYSFICGECQFRDDHVRTIAQRNEPTPCPVCAGDGKTSLMARDFFAEQTGRPPEAEYGRPFLSEALGVHPSQVDEARRRFPDHKFTPDGRMVIESHKERKRVLKDLGFVDHDSYT